MMQMPNRADSLMSDEQSQKLQITASCRKLADLDFLTVTDSFLIIRLEQLGKPPRQILRTKVYWNDLNPDYAQSVIIDYFFEIRQNLTFQVYHQQSPPKLVGKTQTTVGQIFGSLQNGIIRNLQNSNSKKQAGKIIIRCDKVHKNNNKQVQFTMRANDLPDNSFCCFGGTSPFFRVYRKRDKEDLLIYQSQHLKYDLNPQFKQFKLSQRRLCRNDENHPFEVRFYDYSQNGGHKQIGSSFLRMVQAANGKSFTIRNNRSGKNQGTLYLQRVNRYTKYQFGDYIQNGLQLALITCIDFTASNGIARVANSLHYTGHGKPSQYAQALGQVSKILLDYDYDKLVPVFGFGAKVNMPNFSSQGKVHHCFPINGNQQNPNLFQVQGIMKQYNKCIQYLQFGGPTKFSGLLDQAMRQCRNYQGDNNQYMILFILTDGQIHDRQEVIDQIIACGRLPISIIIVGIGNGDFGIMNQLDDDDCLLRDSKGKKTERDLVQFVQFHKFKNSGILLAKEVLQELPRQVAQYYQLMGMTPKDIRNVKTDIQFQKQAILNKKASGTNNSFNKGSNMWN